MYSFEPSVPAWRTSPTDTHPLQQPADRDRAARPSHSTGQASLTLLLSLGAIITAAVLSLR